MPARHAALLLGLTACSGNSTSPQNTAGSSSAASSGGGTHSSSSSGSAASSSSGGAGVFGTASLTGESAFDSDRVVFAQQRHAEDGGIDVQIEITNASGSADCSAEPSNYRRLDIRLAGANGGTQTFPILANGYMAGQATLSSWLGGMGGGGGRTASDGSITFSPATGAGSFETHTTFGSPFPDGGVPELSGTFTAVECPALSH